MSTTHRPRYQDRNTNRRWTATMATRALEHERDGMLDLIAHGIATKGDYDRFLDIEAELSRRDA